MKVMEASEIRWIIAIAAIFTFLFVLFGSFAMLVPAIFLLCNTIFSFLFWRAGSKNKRQKTEFRYLTAVAFKEMEEEPFFAESPLKDNPLLNNHIYNLFCSGFIEKRISSDGCFLSITKKGEKRIDELRNFLGPE